MPRWQISRVPGPPPTARCVVPWLAGSEDPNHVFMKGVPGLWTSSGFDYRQLLLSGHPSTTRRRLSSSAHHPITPLLASLLVPPESFLQSKVSLSLDCPTASRRHQRTVIVAGFDSIQRLNLFFRYNCRPTAAVLPCGRPSKPDEFSRILVSGTYT